MLGGRSDGAGSLAGLSGWAAGERSAGAHSGEAVPILGRSFRRVVVAWSGLRGLAGVRDGCVGELCRRVDGRPSHPAIGRGQGWSGIDGLTEAVVVGEREGFCMATAYRRSALMTVELVRPVHSSGHARRPRRQPIRMIGKARW